MFQRSYKKFIVLVSGYCKSAGTLVACGAHELVFSDAGEIGPIDIQMEKKDDLSSFRGKPVLVYFYNLGDTALAERLAAKYTVLAISDEKRYAILKDLLGKPQPFISGRVTQSDLGRLAQQELSSESAWISSIPATAQAKRHRAPVFCAKCRAKK